MSGWRHVLGTLLVLSQLGGAAATADDAPAADIEPQRDEGSEDYFGARRLRLTTAAGVDFATGDFGSDTQTRLLSYPFSVKLEWEPFVVKVSVPYLRIDGDVVPVAGQPEAVPGARGARDGIGDVVVAATYVYYPSVEFLPLTEFTGKVKFGTADADRGLGTGQIDWTLQLDLSKRFFGWFTPFAGAGYKLVGDPPRSIVVEQVSPLLPPLINPPSPGDPLDPIFEFVRIDPDLRDKWFAYGGVTLRLLDWLNVGATYDWSQSSIAGRPDFHEISPFATVKLGDHFALDPYGLIGLSSNAPDWGVGLQVRFIYDFE